MKFLLAGPLLFISSLALSKVTGLSPSDRAIIHRPFREVHSTSDLPRSIAALCADVNGRLGNPNKKWEPGDLITDETLPRNRLRWAAISGHYFVIHYESGGRGHAYYVVLASLIDRRARLIWRASGELLPDFKGFLSALDKDQLDDSAVRPR